MGKSKDTPLEEPRAQVVERILTDIRRLQGDPRVSDQQQRRDLRRIEIAIEEWYGDLNEEEDEDADDDWPERQPWDEDDDADD